jgi:DNA polymerase-3 subunit delta'
MNSIYPWQSEQWSQLQSRIAAGRMAHGLLLTGPVGVGKRDFANAFARSILCRQPSAEHHACGSCDACLLVKAGTHPDFLTLSPPEDKTQILIDQVRELCRSLVLKSHAGGYKIAILVPADQMNSAAANSLLKTLEEPTDNTLLILISERPARLSATIRSRCQQLRFPAPPPEQGEAWLAQNEAADPALLLRLADGAPLRALTLAQDDTLARRHDWLNELLKLRRSQLDPVRLATEWSSDALMRPLYWMGSYLMDAIRLKSGRRDSIKNIDLYDKLQVIADLYNPQELHKLLDHAWQNLRQAQQSSVNRQLLLEEILIEWGRAGLRRRA